ncbi:uncharacterized protein [Argopecten irradians]
MAEMTDKKVKKNWKVMKVSLEKVAAILYESKKILVDVMVIVKICDHDDMLTRPSSMTKALQPETSVEVTDVEVSLLVDAIGKVT